MSLPREPSLQALNFPELNVFIFAFLLNFVWEFLQAPLFEQLKDAAHWEAVKRCTIATIGDGVIMLVAFWCVALASSRRWILEPTRSELLGFVAVGVVITIFLETLNTEYLMRWEYAPAMPIVPLLDVGLSPLMQWIVLPPLVVWFVRRQLS